MTLLSVRGRRWLAWVAGAVVSLSIFCGTARSQGAATLPASAQAVLQEMAGRAAVIFTGEVVGVDRQDASGFVDVKFRVDQAVKGVSKNGAYVMREWAGLWVGGPERYRVGQRYLMTLTARGSSGMSTPVGGTDGAIPLTAAIDPPLFRGNGDAPLDKAVDAPEAQVDLRWLAASAARTAVAGAGAAKTGSVRPRLGGLTVAQTPTEGSDSGAAGGKRPIAFPAPGPADGGDAGDSWSGAVAPLTSVAATAAAQAGSYPAATKLSSVLTLLTTGSGGAHAAR